MMLARGYILTWAAWFTWVNTVGRFSLSLPTTLIFDIICFAGLFIMTRSHHSARFARSIRCEPHHSEQTGEILIPSISAWLVIASIVATAVLQVPLDWDGLDYHLPPIIESWHSGFWHRTEYPYFCAKNYPKTHSILALWWLIHFGKIFGMRLLLILPLAHWCAGLWASLKLIGRNKWVVLFWIAYPLAAREGPTWLADLPALSTLLCFLVFVREKDWVPAAAALALHGAMKFSNLPTAVMAAAFVNLRWAIEERSLMTWARAKVNLFFIAAFAAAAIVQPIQNMKAEGRPFGPLKCVIAGHDFCKGTLDPIKLVHAPIIPDYKLEESTLTKILRGWTPNQLVPGSDVDRGGFGIAWILPLLAALILLRKKLPPLLREHRDGLWALATVLMADLTVSALWYGRFHLPLGWVLGMSAALACVILEKTQYRKPILVVTSALLFVQSLWLVPQRVWFLGAHSLKDTAIVAENLSSIVMRGFPAHATNPADLRSLALLARPGHERVIICGERLRPAGPAYSASLSNILEWHQPVSEPWPLTPCPEMSRSADLEVEGTKVWFESL